MSEKEMTAAEILRKAAEGGFEGSTGETYRNISVLMGAGRNVLNSETCRALADQIEDEIGEARDESLRQSAELWAKANGWPEFKEGESFDAWLARCTLKLPLYDDGEPVQFGGLARVGDDLGEVCKMTFSGNGCESVTIGFEGDSSATHYMCLSGGRVRRPHPEVLDADGVPIRKDDTVYGTGREQHRYTVKVPCDINPEEGLRFSVRCYDHNDRGIVWCDPSMLTHKEPDSQAKIDADAIKTTNRYWGCSDLSCSSCPALKDGKNPRERYGTGHCYGAKALDLLRRQRKLDARTMGGR